MIRVVGPFPPPFGGVAIHCIRLLEQLRSHGASAVGISLGGVPHGVDRVQKIGWRFFFSRTLVHLHTDEGNHRWLRLFSWWWRLTGTPYVLTIHSFRNRREFANVRLVRSIGRSVLNAHSVIAISSSTARAMESELGIRHPRTRIIPSALPISKWELAEPFPAAVPEDWISASVRIIANAGRVVRYNGADLYGIDVLVQALALCKDPNLSLCIAIGEVVDTELWSALENSIKADPRIFVVRDLQSPLTPLVKHSHIVVRPTRTEGGPSLTVGEALELGKWAIASDAVERPFGTTLFESGNASALATAIDACARSVKNDVFPPPVPQHVDAIMRILNAYQRVTE